MDIEDIKQQHRAELGDLFRALGEVVFDFSNLDERLTIAISHLSGLNAESGYHREGRIIISEMPTKSKVHAIASLMREHVDAEVFSKEEIKKLTNLLGSAELARNNALHSTYYSIVDWNDDGSLKISEVRREKVTAKSSKGLKKQEVDDAIGELESCRQIIDRANEKLHELLTRATGDDAWDA